FPPGEPVVVPVHDEVQVEVLLARPPLPPAPPAPPVIVPRLRNVTPAPVNAAPAPPAPPFPPRPEMVVKVPLVEVTVVVALPLSPPAVNGPRNLPSFGRAKFPTLAGLVISRWRDRRLHSWVAGRGAWVATPAVEVGSEPLIGCAQARGRRAGEDGSSNPRSE